jgi:type 2 lantibiotic biosynthesis protein LanM
MLSAREELLGEGGPISAFAGARLRFIKMQTTFYRLLVKDSYHPDALGDALSRDRLFDRLFSVRDEADDALLLDRGTRQALERGEVPVFSVTTTGHGLICDGQVICPDYFAESGMERVRRRIGCLSEEDLARQLWLIRASLVNIDARPEAAMVTAPAPALDGKEAPLERDRIEAAVRAVIDRLRKTALQSEGSVNWLGLFSSRGRPNDFGPLKADLAGGLGGVALFLRRAAEVLGDEEAGALARSATVSWREKLGSQRGAICGAGGLHGWGGVLYALASLGEIDLARTCLADLCREAATDEYHDLYLGVAGGALGALALHQASGLSEALDAAGTCGERLLAGAPWVHRDRIEPSTGYAHGAAGIAYALHRLAQATGEQRFEDAAAQTLAFERSAFASEEGNWRQMGRRFEGETHRFVPFFCNGAPGVGLGRLGMIWCGQGHDGQVEDEVRAAVATTLAHGFGDNHSLCHGDFGSLDFLVEAHRALPRLCQAGTIDGVVTRIIAGLERRGPICGTVDRIESPGLLTGLAGIGYGLLRLLAPERVPSVLLLAPAGGR